jgi:hypothetical protein
MVISQKTDILNAHYNQIDLKLTTIPNGTSTERFQTETYELLDENKKNTQRYIVTALEKMEEWPAQ